MPERVFAFAEALRTLLAARDAAEFEESWRALDVDALGWEALRRVHGRPTTDREPILDEIDGLLLRLLDRLPLVIRKGGPMARRVATFRVPEAERLQHAAAAALVLHRYGPAGLATVAADPAAPVARRYRAFFLLAEQHPEPDWPLFQKYLAPHAHHAFVGVASEAARFYPGERPGDALVVLFGRIRSDLHLRAFLSPRILESLFVLSDPQTLPFFRGLLIAGHTAPDPRRCEVMRSLVMVRRFTGSVEPNIKFTDAGSPVVEDLLNAAEADFEQQRDLLTPVAVI